MMNLRILMRKQGRLLVMVASMVLMLLISTQVLLTHTFKHETMVERVLRSDSPQVMIHIHDRDFLPEVLSTLERYNAQTEEGAAQISVDQTLMFNHRRNNFELLYEVLTPRLEASLPLLEGQALRDLKADEAAIVQSFADELRRAGIDPFDHQLRLDSLEGERYFRVVSIVDYPNFNDPYVPDNGLRAIPLFDFPYPSVALIREDQLRSVQTIEERTVFFGRETVRERNAPGVAQVVHVRFERYSPDRERALMDYLYRSLGFYPDEISFYPIYEYADYLSTQENLYALIARYGLGAMMLLSGLGLVVLVRQQFLQNIKNLTLLVTLGYPYWRVNVLLIARFAVAGLMALATWLSLNVLAAPWLQSDRSLAKIIDQTPLILGVSALGVGIAFGVWIALSGYLRVRSLRHSLSSLKDQRKTHIRGLSLNRYWKINLAIKGLLSRFSTTTLMVSVMGLSLASVMAFALIAHQVSTIYNEETLGVKFDYLVLDAPFRHYELTNTVASSQVWVEKFSNYLFVDVHYTRNYFSYYKSSVLFFFANMEGFVEPVEGELPEDLRDKFWEWKYNMRQAMASRKQMEKTNSFVYSVERVERERSAERGYLFISAISPSQANRESAAQILGTMNTLIDQGWIAYVYRDYLMIEAGVPYLEMYLFNMEEGRTRTEVEAFMDAHGIRYMAFDEITAILNDVNRISQAQSFGFVGLASVLLMSLLMIVVSVYFKTMQLEQADNIRLMEQLGLSATTLKQVHHLQLGMVWLSASVIAALSVAPLFGLIQDGMLQAYGLYFTTPLPAGTFGLWWGVGLLIAAIMALNYLWVQRKTK